MGTHIVVFIEIDFGGVVPPFSDPTQIYSLTEGSFLLDRDYRLFDALAGGRSHLLSHEDRDADRIPLISPRGVPSPCSLVVASNYYRLILAPDDRLPDRHFWDKEKCIPSTVADQWTQAGQSIRATVLQWVNSDVEGRTWPVVSLPHLSSPGWLKLDEVDRSLKHHGLDLSETVSTFRILRSAMKSAIEEHHNDRVRLVFWFE